LGDHIHRRQASDASFKSSAELLAFGREAEFTAFARGMTAAATVVVEDVLRQGLLTLAGRSHLVESRDGGLRRLLLLGEEKSTQKRGRDEN
jgi:hypothetical protein